MSVETPTRTRRFTFWRADRPERQTVADSLFAAAHSMNAFADRVEAENRRMLDEIIEDENRIRNWELTVIGSDGEEHQIPLRCSRKQVRKIKLAIFDADGDALAVER